MCIRTTRKGGSSAHPNKVGHTAVAVATHCFIAIRVSRQARKSVLLHVHTTVHIMQLVVRYSSRNVVPNAHKTKNVCVSSVQFVAFVYPSRFGLIRSCILWTMQNIIGNHFKAKTTPDDRQIML